MNNEDSGGTATVDAPINSDPLTVTVTDNAEEFKEGANLRGYIVLRVDKGNGGTGPANWPTLSVWNRSSNDGPIPVDAHNGEQAIRLLLGDLGENADTKNATWVAVPTRSFQPIHRESRIQVAESYNKVELTNSEPS